MVEETDPSRAASPASLTCPRCGAPLPRPGEDRFVTCGYCGVRTEISGSAAPQSAPSLPEVAGRPIESPYPSTEGDVQRGGRSYIVPPVAAVVVIVAVIAVFAASQPPSNAAGTSVAHCSVTINASATSGPTPFTATFTAQVTAPPGVTTSDPEWQFGPFGPGFDFNYTYGTTVTHTWTATGSYGVHVTVPDSSSQGCWATMSVNVT